MPFTNYTHQALQNALFGKTSAFGALASVPTLYVGLSITTPTMAGGNATEPGEAHGYARVQSAASDWSTASSADPSVLSNAADIEFPEVEESGGLGDWGTVTHFVLYDAITAGNMIAFGALTTTKNPTEGDIPRFTTGSLVTRMRSPA